MFKLEISVFFYMRLFYFSLFSYFLFADECLIGKISEIDLNRQGKFWRNPNKI